MTVAATPLLQDSYFRPGYTQGLTAPSLAMRVSLPGTDARQYARLWRALQDATAGWSEFEHLDPELLETNLAHSTFAHPLAEWLLSAPMHLQSLCGIAITSHGLSALDANGDSIQLYVPTQTWAIQGLRQMMSYLFGAKEGHDYSALRKLCITIRAGIATFPPNTGNLLCAASRMNIPTTHSAGKFHMFGQGRNQVLLYSSLPGSESCFGAATAKDKIATNTLLRGMALPVPKQAVVKTLEAASRQATRIGYPVVLKPADQDGGSGVFPALRTPEELARVWELCRAKSANTILEQHIDGLDYRLLVVRGEMIAAIERSPAQVIGNGQDTIARLIEQENIRRKPESGKVALLSPLPQDAQAVAVLASQGLCIDDLLPQGKVAKLRHACNHAQGGTVRWCHNDVHPENIQLARRVAEVLRLEVAGIDLISMDITQPWQQTGAMICEVNNQPSMGRPTHHRLFERLIEKLLPRGGVIPQIAFVGQEEAVGKNFARLELKLSSRGLRVGTVHAGQVRAKGAPIATTHNIYQGHRIAIMHPELDIILLGLSTKQDLRKGLASPRLDFVIPVGSPPLPFVEDLARDYKAMIGTAEKIASLILSHQAQA